MFSFNFRADLVNLFIKYRMAKPVKICGQIGQKLEELFQSYYFKEKKIKNKINTGT